MSVVLKFSQNSWSVSWVIKLNFLMSHQLQASKLEQTYKIIHWQEDNIDGKNSYLEKKKKKRKEFIQAEAIYAICISVWNKSTDFKAKHMIKILPLIIIYEDFSSDADYLKMPCFGLVTYSKWCNKTKFGLLFSGNSMCYSTQAYLPPRVSLVGWQRILVDEVVQTGQSIWVTSFDRASC